MIDALTQAKSALEGVRGALGIFSKTEVDMTLGMLDRAIAKYTSLDAICQDLQEKTYTQAMRIAELEAKLAEAEKQEPVTDMYRNKCADGSRCLHGCHTSERCYHDTHPQPKAEKQEPYGWVSQHTTKGLYEWQFNKELSGVYKDTAISILPVYTHPQPKREWVGLTDEEEQELDEKYGDDISVYIDQRDLKLKEKNT
jgi:hypothetical protein